VSSEELAGFSDLRLVPVLEEDHAFARNEPPRGVILASTGGSDERVLDKGTGGFVNAPMVWNAAGDTVYWIRPPLVGTDRLTGSQRVIYQPPANTSLAHHLSCSPDGTSFGVKLSQSSEPTPELAAKFPRARMVSSHLAVIDADGCHILKEGILGADIHWPTRRAVVTQWRSSTEDALVVLSLDEPSVVLREVAFTRIQRSFCQLSPAGTHALLIANAEEAATVVDLETGTQLVLASKAMFAAWAPDGRTVAVVTNTAEVSLFDAVDGRQTILVAGRPASMRPGFGMAELTSPLPAKTRLMLKDAGTQSACPAWSADSRMLHLTLPSSHAGAPAQVILDLERREYIQALGHWKNVVFCPRNA
jgi:hypothetical protein